MAVTIDFILPTFIQQIRDKLPEEFNEIEPFLNQANKASFTTEEEAYLLGKLLRKAVRKKELHPYIEEKVNDVIKNTGYRDYYEGKIKPHFDNGWILVWVTFSIIGFISIIVGIKMLLENYYSIGFHTTYLVQVVKGGGYMIILGLVFFVGGIVKSMQEYKLKALSKSYGALK